MKPAICPGCARGECCTCPGTAWCDETSFPCICDCAKANHDLPFTVPCDGCSEQTETPIPCLHGRELCIDCRYFNDCKDCRRERCAA